MNDSNLDIERKNQNGSISKTFKRKLKPISFCLIDPEQKDLLEKIEKFTYGNYFKNIIGFLSNEEVDVIKNSNGKCEPIIPTKQVDLNIKKGFLTCRTIAQSLIKHKLVDNMVNELRNFISDEFIKKLAEDRGLLSNTDSTISNETNNSYESSSTYDYGYGENNAIGIGTYKMAQPPSIFSGNSLEQIKTMVRKHANLPDNVEIDNDFVEQFIMDNPEVISNF